MESIEFKIGDEVELSNKSKFWELCSRNDPKNCKGVIDFITDHNLDCNIGVRWSTGYSNIYNPEDLIYWSGRDE